MARIRADGAENRRSQDTLRGRLKTVEMGIVGRGADFEADLEIYAWNEAELVHVKSHRMT